MMSSPAGTPPRNLPSAYEAMVYRISDLAVDAGRAQVEALLPGGSTAAQEAAELALGEAVAAAVNLASRFHAPDFYAVATSKGRLVSGSGDVNRQRAERIAFALTETARAGLPTDDAPYSVVALTRLTLVTFAPEPTSRGRVDA